MLLSIFWLFQIFSLFFKLWNNKCCKFRRARVWGKLTKMINTTGLWKLCNRRRGASRGKERPRRINEETSVRYIWEWTKCGSHQTSILTESQPVMDLETVPWRNDSSVIVSWARPEWSNGHITGTRAYCISLWDNHSLQSQIKGHEKPFCKETYLKCCLANTYFSKDTFITIHHLLTLWVFFSTY